jgi:hypothetical protein
MPEPGSRRKAQLPPDHSSAVAFLDESGTIASDRFFAVGCLKLSEPSWLLREVQRWRDRRHWYQEIHFVDLTRDALPAYREVVDILAVSDLRFSCFVADRKGADPVARFGSSAKAYEKLAEQLLIGSIAPNEIVTVLADDYSTPEVNPFEVVVRAEVNRRLGCLAVASVVRIDSKAAIPLQLVDLLTSAVAFEFRQNAGLAGHKSPKAELALYVRQQFNVSSFLKGAHTPKINVKLYSRRMRLPASIPALRK